ncbi:peptidogycan hydrolase YocH [Bacillus licheniformis]|nr:peptidogycan hydrolase YocH [Bacillus licheniformis]
MKKLRHQNFLFAIAWLSGLALFVNAPGSEASEWIEPIKGEITDQFGTRGGKHKGLDIAAPEGEAVAAAADGTISKSYQSDSYGQVIFIKHDNGYETVYAHLSKRLKKEKERVKKASKSESSALREYRPEPTCILKCITVHGLKIKDMQSIR